MNKTIIFVTGCILGAFCNTKLAKDCGVWAYKKGKDIYSDLKNNVQDSIKEETPVTE